MTWLEPFLGGDPFTYVVRYVPWSTVTSRVEVGSGRGLYISEISTKMRLASYTHGSVIPWNTLNFMLDKTNVRAIKVEETS